MDVQQFDGLIRQLATMTPRRRLFGLLGGSALGALVATILGDPADARKKKKKKRKGRKGGGGGGLGLRAICEPGADTCKAGLACDSPTTRNSCSSTIEGVEAWCCVPPGGTCTECDCCGSYYCGTDDDNNPTCLPNPEG